MRIGIIDDERPARSELRFQLEEMNPEMEILEGNSGTEAIRMVTEEPLDLLFLDINLGDENGFDLCRKIRMKSNVPILFLTALTGELELVRGFSIGGDDYLTKPFRITELLARVNALVRRYNTNEADFMWTSGEITFDRAKYQVLKNGVPIELTPVEVKLVYTLINAWPASKTREQILYEVWDKGLNFVEENTLNVNVSRLREKLGRTKDGEYVGTVRGVGYRWNQDVRK